MQKEKEVRCRRKGREMQKERERCGRKEREDIEGKGLEMQKEREGRCRKKGRGDAEREGKEKGL